MTREHTPEEIKYRLSDLGVQIGNIAIEYIATLEKENAELKETVTKMNNVIIGTFNNLTKAKELLKRYVPYRQITDSKAYKDLAEEAEQFLNSEVEK